MTDAAHHRKANALVATSYDALGPVDARVVEALLDSLEGAGVAAYVDAVEHAPLLSELFVDGALRRLAEDVVAIELPGLLAELRGAPAEVDDEFASIIASLEGSFDHGVPPWPVAEDAGARTWTRDDDDDEPLPAWNPAPYDEGHYVAPPPPPVPSAHPVTRYAIAAIVAGVILLVAFPLLGVTVSRGWSIVAALAIVGGVGTLVWRMQDRPPTDSGPDDGAVI
jgi:hypothetical protein